MKRTNSKFLSVNATTFTSVWGENQRRHAVFIQNQSGFDLRVSYRDTPTSEFGFIIPPGESYNPTTPGPDEIRIIGTAPANVLQRFYTYEVSD